MDIFNMETSESSTLQACRDELAAYFGALAILANECIEPGAGERMLRLPEHGVSGPLARHIDVTKSEIGQMLPAWFQYAHCGVLAAGYTVKSLGVDDGPMERLGDLLTLLDAKDAYFELCLDAAAGSAEVSHLQLLVDKVRARAALDNGEQLTLAEVASLADMNERSVRNATSAGEGAGRLVVNASGHVSNEEALRWLAGRRNYKPTQRRQLPSGTEPIPDSLGEAEIPRFVLARLTALVPSWGDLSQYQYNSVPAWACAAAERSNLAAERVLAAASLPLDIRPGECQGLARMLEVDPVWFTHQVMFALFPEQVDMLMNPEHWRVGVAGASTQRDDEATFTVDLSESMLKHGYIDFPMSAKSFFPEDCFGGREEGNTGEPVELIYGEHRESTDMRVKSSRTFSPRRRFSGWLNRELGARPTDRIRVARCSERVYKLTHVAS